LTEVENDTPNGRKALETLFPHTGKAQLVGVTGAPGTGKSSLVNQIALQWRRAKKSHRVAVVAVDPSSPFSGGAVLGDRVRMRDLAGDAGVFIRSMATRGSLGGLAAATAAMTQVFDASGFDVVLIETVGAGQAEVDIARLAHTTLVVEAPNFGDDIQAIKAGILEIADLLVINKADLEGVENTERALRGMLDLAHPAGHTVQHHGLEMMTGGGEGADAQSTWMPPILRTVATTGLGVPALVEAIEAHAVHLHATGQWGQRERLRLETELHLRVQETLLRRFHTQVSDKDYNKVLELVLKRKLPPGAAARELLKIK
jgi:LAO/AO transport system kinase